ncbi:MAG: replication-associated recombination protein A, partial [Candidatus Saccharibacteria bacterium]
AFIKSVRGSDPDAALFWLAVMVHGGEDPLFIARRLVILAAEDIGLADPHALPLAVSAFQAAHFIGYPEARIPLAEATIYLATAPKSNSAINAIDGALDFIRKMPSIKVPPHISDSSHSKAHTMGKGIGYKYPHSYGGYIEQSYLPAEAGSPEFYQPTNNGNERRIKEFIARIEELKQEAKKR